MTHTVLDEDNAQAILNNFIAKIDEWINMWGFDIKPNVLKEDAETIMELNDFSEYKYEKLMEFSFILISYANSLQDGYNKERTILDFCDSSIAYIICDIKIEGDEKYMKGDEKYAFKVKQNPLASQLNRLRNVSWARLNAISHKIEYVRKMADIIHDIAKRRKYE